MDKKIFLRQLYNSRKKAGLCVNCGKKPGKVVTVGLGLLITRSHCEDCINIKTINRLNRQKEYILNKLCPNCKRYNDSPYKYCKTCRQCSRNTIKKLRREIFSNYGNLTCACPVHSTDSSTENPSRRSNTRRACFLSWSIRFASFDRVRWSYVRTCIC